MATGNFAVVDVSLRSPRNVYICMEKLIINEINVSQSIYFNLEIIITGGHGLEPPRLLKAICLRSRDFRHRLLMAVCSQNFTSCTLMDSASFLAEISVRSPRKLFIFII